MADSIVLVIDAGSSAIRCAAVDDAGTTIASASREWVYAVEPDAPDFARALDSASICRAVFGLLGETLAQSRRSPAQVQAVSITSQRQAVVFLDEGGNAVYAGPNIDLRAVFEGAAIDDEHGGLVYRTTGHLPSMLFAPAKLKWFRENRPSHFEKIACVLPLACWIGCLLTGETASEPVLLAEAGLLDLSSKSPAADLLETMGFSRNLLTTLAADEGIFGRLTRQASEKSSLKAGTPVVVSGPDTQTALLGLGVAQPGEVGIVAGWSTAVQMVTGAPVFDSARRTWVGLDLHGGHVIESSPGDQGNTYARVARMLGYGLPASYHEMDSGAHAQPAGSHGVKAAFGPARMNAAAVGMKTGGFIMPTPLTVSDASRASLVRALLESFAFSIRANIEQIEAITRIRATRVSIGGGMTRTRAFVDICAAVLGRDLQVQGGTDATTLGAWLAARRALGDITDADAACLAAGRAYRCHPATALVDEYAMLYDEWTELVKSLDGLPM